MPPAIEGDDGAVGDPGGLRQDSERRALLEDPLPLEFKPQLGMLSLAPPLPLCSRLELQVPLRVRPPQERRLLPWALP